MEIEMQLAMDFAMGMTTEANKDPKGQFSPVFGAIFGIELVIVVLLAGLIYFMLSSTPGAQRFFFFQEPHGMLLLSKSMCHVLVYNFMGLEGNPKALLILTFVLLSLADMVNISSFINPNDGKDELWFWTHVVFLGFTTLIQALCGIFLYQPKSASLLFEIIVALLIDVSLFAGSTSSPWDPPSVAS